MKGARGGHMCHILEYTPANTLFKPKTVKLVFVTSPLSMQHLGERAANDWFRIRISCWDCFFSEVALKFQLCVLIDFKANNIIISSNVTCSCHGIDDKLLILLETTITENFSLFWKLDYKNVLICFFLIH
jgi:hypothetical protein